ncbi:MAG: tetratricopeptide repeat protein [Planctomycetota bacterium]
MNPTLNLVAAAAVGALSSAIVAVSLRPEPAAPAPVRAADGAALRELQAEVEALAENVRLAAPAVSDRAPAEAASGAASAELRALVAELVRPEALADSGELQEVEDAADTVDVAAVDRINAILESGIDGAEAFELWREAHAAGQLHAVLAALEERHAAEPPSAQNCFDRARAYYAAAGVHPNNNDGNWWVDSNDAYSDALELDPEHWDARFQKAKNMSFWPTAYGGQAEAIRHFEVLVEQQSKRAARPEFAETYWRLGNLYDQQGRPDRARRAWESGLALFPEDGRIRGKLSSLR